MALKYHKYQPTQSTQNGDIDRYLLETDEAGAALLRTSAMQFVPTYAIDYAIFRVNQTSLYPEKIALRLGLLVIDNEKYQHQEGVNHRLSVVGPAKVTTKDLSTLPFRYETPILELQEGEKLIVDCRVRQGFAINHSKWRPFSTFVIDEEEEGLVATIKGVGMLDGDSIMASAVDNIKVVIEANNSNNIYFRHIIPDSFKS